MIHYYTHNKLGKKQGNPRIAIQFDAGSIYTVKATKDEGKTRKSPMVRSFEFEPAFDGYTNGMIKQECPVGKLTDSFNKFLFSKKEDKNEKVDEQPKSNF